MTTLFHLDPAHGAWAKALLILIDAGAKGFLLLLIAALITLSMRRASAAARHLVWSLALCGLVLLPIFSIAMPKWQLPILPHMQAATTHQQTPTAVAMNLPPSVGDQGSGVPPSGGTESRLKPGLPNEPEPAAIRAHTVPMPITPACWILLAWLAVGLIMIAPLIIGILALAWMVSRCRPFDVPYWSKIIETLAASLGLSRPVRVLQSGPETMPMATGLFSAAILLPEAAAEWDDDKRRSVLLHELAHVKRRDCLTHALARVAVSMHWFNPLAWVALRRLRIERERACDDLVLTAGERPSTYADHLLDIARTFRAGTLASAAAITMARKSQLEGRLLAVLDPKQNRTGIRRRMFYAGILVLLCLSIPLGMLELSARGEGAANTEHEIKPQVIAEKDHAINFPNARFVIYNGPRGSGSSLNTALSPDDSNSVCGHPGVVSEVKRKYLGLKDGGWHFIFTRSFPVDVSRDHPEVTKVKEKEIIYKGGREVLFEDEHQWIGIEDERPQIEFMGSKPVDGATERTWLIDTTDTLQVMYRGVMMPTDDSWPQNWGAGTNKAGDQGPVEIGLRTKIEGNELVFTTIKGQGAREYKDRVGIVSIDAKYNISTTTDKRIPIPPGAKLEEVWRREPVAADPHHYISLWEGRFVRDGQTLQTIVYAAAVARATDPDIEEALDLYGKSGKDFPLIRLNESQRNRQSATVLQFRWVATNQERDRAEKLPVFKGELSEHEPPSWWVQHEAQLSERDVASAEVLPNSAGKDYVISVRLTDDGKKGFAELTGKNIGRRLAIVANGRLVSAPNVMEPITGGQIQISGGFSRKQAEELVAAMKESNPAIASGPAGTGFGPIHERVLNYSGENCLIDFDKDRLLGTPKSITDTKAAFAWIAAKGVDAGCGDESTGLIGMELIVQPMPNTFWETASGEGVANSPVFKYGKPGDPIYMSARGELPATYAFKTREGGTGIVQIIEFVGPRPSGVRIRYKMVQPD